MSWTLLVTDMHVMDVTSDGHACHGHNIGRIPIDTYMYVYILRQCRLR